MPNTVPDPGWSERVEVALGLLRDESGRVLVARRRADQHLGGLWEFPGGKVESGESPAAALARELHEELGVVVEGAIQCLSVRHAYPGREVVLRVFRVTGWTGRPHGRDGQPLEWREPQDLDAARFPAANRPILNALRLPERYLITPEPPGPTAIPAVVEAVAGALRAGAAGMVQVRAPNLERDVFREFLGRVASAAAAASVPVLANAPPGWLAGMSGLGLHLPERRWHQLQGRPDVEGWVAASVHDAEGLARVADLGVDFAVLGPVRATATHPEARPLGWQRFAELARQSAVPVYALGGMDPGCLGSARAAGAQGVAGIRGLLARAPGQA